MTAPSMTICPICASENPATSTSCAVCGAPLSADPASAYSSALPPGTKLHGGLYSVGRVLGQGGFGITYLGGDIRAHRPVAIKEFFPFGSTRRGSDVHPFGGLAAADFATGRSRFLDEASILTRFNHPGIVDVYGTFEENHTAYMVMELLRGQTLGQLLQQRGGLPEQEAVGYIARVGEALEVVHVANLLHRDLKPDNIMLTDDGGVVLIDFGTARAFAAGKTGRMTTMVTPGYAPLEQYGRDVRFGPFTDIYALGATLYHALTGQQPASATDRAIGVDLVPPSKLNPAVSVGIDDVVMWSMKMRVAERPQSVREFLAALRSSSRIAPSPAPTPPAPETIPAGPHRPTWRPPVSYDGPYDVEVKGPELQWPDRCVCCFQPSDSTYTVQRTLPSGFLSLFEETRAWDVPYCTQCLRHVELDAAGPASGLGGMVAGAFMGGPIGLLIGVGSAAASLIGLNQHQSQMERLLKPSCATVGPAVSYRGWYKDTHAFTFLNREFADVFRRQNGGSQPP
jgi:serine/threonine protein kinase